MKKKVFILACLILGVVSMYQKSQTQLPADEFLLMNVEALATSEYMDYNITCKCSGDIVCPINNVGVEYVFRGYSLR
ncbi:MAG: hypothetical protein J6J26_06515 [Bacteroides sp.]|nr:hypothetical protein [Bacteroides sp.]